MMNGIYGLMAKNSAVSLNEDLENVVKIVDEFIIPDYGKFEDIENKSVIVKNISSEKNIYDFLFDNLHIHIDVRTDSIVYSVRLKKKYVDWAIEGEDYSHPKNETYEVYCWYMVPVLDITKATGSIYKEGNWNKYFHKTMKEFINYINGFTDYNSFNKNYS